MIDQFRHALKAARSKRGMSARELSEATGGVVTRATIANWESGRKEGIDVLELITVAKALEVPALSLLYPLDGMDDKQAQEAIDFSGYEDDYRVLYRWCDVRLLASLSPTPPNLASEWRQVVVDAERAGWDIG